MISWALMANDSTLKPSKTLGILQLINFSTLAGTLGDSMPKCLDLCRAAAEV